MKPKDKKIIKDSEQKGIPIFVLTAKDINSTSAIYAYLGKCMSNCNKLHVKGVISRLAEFTNWQITNENKTKIPD